MKNTFMRWVLLLIAMAVSATSTFAQLYEIHPYAGGQFLTNFKAAPDQIGRFDFRNPAVFGLKGGMFATENWLIEGNAGYVNQMKFRNHIEPAIYGIQWEALGSFHAFRARFARVFPYFSAGIGGLTLNARNPLDADDEDKVVYAVNTTPRALPGSPFAPTTQAFIIEDGDTFFNFSYGGGVKGQRLWGPIGLRADLRGRTMPNFYGKAVHGFEMTGGLLVNWGER